MIRRVGDMSLFSVEGGEVPEIGSRLSFEGYGGRVLDIIGNVNRPYVVARMLKKGEVRGKNA
ncbi:MAG: hypothetical protein V1921_08935 [Candidatus Altiarchaeota archaeon]